jgi:regulatory protein
MDAPRVARFDLALDRDPGPADAAGPGEPEEDPGPAARVPVAAFGEPSGAGEAAGSGPSPAAASTGDDGADAAGPRAGGSVADWSSLGTGGAEAGGSAAVAGLDELGTRSVPAAVADLGGAAGGAASVTRVARLPGRRGTGGVDAEQGTRRSPSPPDDRPPPRRRAGASRSSAGAAAPSPGEAPSEREERPARPRRVPGPKQIEPDADPVAAAREICLRLLTDRARTRTELAQALARRGVPDEAAHTVLERFDEVGLIDDAAFAGQWVRSRHRHRGLARRAIAQELRRKGVDDETAGEALAEVDDGSEERRARELVDRKLRTLPADTPEQRTVAARKLVGMLARKGYGAGTAYGVVREALAAHGAETDELGEPPAD